MRVELVPADPGTKPRHWPQNDQAFAMMLGSFKRYACRAVFLHQSKETRNRGGYGLIITTIAITAILTRLCFFGVRLLLGD